MSGGSGILNSLVEALLKSASDFLNRVSKTANEVIHISEGGNQVEEILSYPMQASGHMLRPLLVYLTALAVSDRLSEEEQEKLVYFAAAVELLHNASLIHDDMLDQEETRRGQASLYKKYGYRNAILSGNCYYIKALELGNRHLEPSLTGDILETAFKMCLGELLQEEYKDQMIPDDRYFEIIRSKTASLTALACKGAADILKSEHVEQWRRIGEFIGVIYQMKDDLKDKDLNIRPDFGFERFVSEASSALELLLAEVKCNRNHENFIDLIHLF